MICLSQLVFSYISNEPSRNLRFFWAHNSIWKRNLVCVIRNASFDTVSEGKSIGGEQTFVSGRFHPVFAAEWCSVGRMAHWRWPRHRDRRYWFQWLEWYCVEVFTLNGFCTNNVNGISTLWTNRIISLYLINLRGRYVTVAVISSQMNSNMKPDFSIRTPKYSNITKNKSRRFALWDLGSYWWT